MRVGDGALQAAGVVMPKASHSSFHGAQVKGAMVRKAMALNQRLN
jgi:hypothetical protein